jgi:hypothetical protein
MAKLSALIPAVASSLGLPEKTVAIYARHLREARLISTGGRGPGGAEMTPQDCANLLMAIVGGNLAKDSALTIDHYASLPAGRDEQRDRWELENFKIPKLITLQERHSFGAALEALIASAKDGHLQQAMAEACPTVEGYRIPLAPRIEIRLQGPQPLARITILSSQPLWSEHITYSEPPPFGSSATREAIEEWAEQNAQKYRLGDMVQLREFTDRTILVLGELLRS